MMNMFIEPIDVWLFRDGRPFDALSDHRARSLFPPYPTVVQGAIRTNELALKNVDLHDRRAIEAAVGTASDYRGLRIRGPFLTERKQNGELIRYYPQPADAYTVNKERHEIKTASDPEAISGGIMTSAPVPYLIGLQNGPVKGESGLWLSEDALCKYLRGERVAGTPANKLFVHEPRFGIGVENDRSKTKEGALYQVDFIRPYAGVGLYVDMGGYNGWPSSGLLRLGGESRGARFEKVEALAWPPKGVPLPDPLPNRFKVYFATPAYFENGWRPKDWTKFFSEEVELVAAAVSRYEAVGGFDMTEDSRSPDMHRAARRYVPAGSVYYFKHGGKASLTKDLIQNAITDFGAQIGFGQVIITAWKEN
jgi:CRISPR-associated protein Cmr3